MNINILSLINVQACLHVSGGYGSVFLNKARQVEACSLSEIVEFPLVLGRDFSGRVVAKGLGVGHDINIGDEVWGALPPHLQGCHAQFVRVNKTSVSEYADLIMCLTFILRSREVADLNMGMMVLVLKKCSSPESGPCIFTITVVRHRSKKLRYELKMVGAVGLLESGFAETM
jgi:hypothetical protein